ncbi:MAG: Gfo/Idh/MocA family oxidoreductase [Caldilineales bacterium]|nr:Gfo/Idh/MocA family oxidoreductase [Caldilineales bacterium]
MSSSSPIRLAIIGAGIFARDAHLPALAALPGVFEVTAVGSRSLESAQNLARLLPNPADCYDDIAALLARSDIDAVDIITPIPTLAEMTERALAAGKHVLSAKPIAADTGQARAMIDLHGDYPDQVWMIAETSRRDALFMAAAEAIQNGAIGQPRLVHWTVYSPSLPGMKYFDTGWRQQPDFPGGYLVDGGVHHAAVLRLLAGEIESVQALTAQFRPDLPPADTLTSTVRFASGAVGHYTVTFALKPSRHPDLWVSGDRGDLQVGWEELVVTSEGVEQRMHIPRVHGIRQVLADFAAAIHGGPNPNSPQECLADLAVIEAMLRSAESEKREQP